MNIDCVGVILVYIKYPIFFLLGLILSSTLFWVATIYGYTPSDPILPITSFSLDISHHFNHVDHNTIVQRARFANPLGVRVRTEEVSDDILIADTFENSDLIIPLWTSDDLIRDPFPSRFRIPDFPHYNINEHYIGRLKIPALNISHALYFSGDDFYLRRDWRGRPSNAGELYIDGRSTGNLFRLDNLINGHNMMNGTKFGRLQNLRDIQDTVYIFINEYATGRTFIYQIFAARIVRAQDTGVHLNFSSAFVRQQYYQIQIDNSFLPRTIIDFNSPILTLNTCYNPLPDGHLLVFAVLVGWE